MTRTAGHAAPIEFDRPMMRRPIPRNRAAIQLRPRATDKKNVENSGTARVRPARLRQALRKRPARRRAGRLRSACRPDAASGARPGGLRRGNAPEAGAPPAAAGRRRQRHRAGNLRAICAATMDRAGAAVDRNLARRRIFPGRGASAPSAPARLPRGPARGYAARAQRRGRRLRRGAAHPRKERRS